MTTSSQVLLPAPRRRRTVVWILLYLALAALPLVVLLIGSTPRGGGLWWDFAMALGFGALAVMGLQFALTARFRRAAAPFGTDIIYYFHRWAALAAMLLLLAHYAILRVGYAEALGPWNPRDAPWHMTAGRVALLLFGALIVTSLWRKPLGLEYDAWRIAHSGMAIGAVALAIVHIDGVGHYTRAAWKGNVWIVYSAGWLLLVAYIRGVKPLRLLRHRYRVVSVAAERGTAWTLTLEPEQPPALAFRPGQFAWLTLGHSPFAAKEHPFSFSGCADDRGTLQFTIKELGDFTRTIGRTAIGQTAYVEGPHGAFTTDFHADAPGFVFIAGGVGIAPIMSMLRTLAQRGERRPLILIYGNWHWDAAIFREELAELARRLALAIVHVVQEPPVGWSGETGYITETVLRRALPSAALGHTFFICGPKPMTDLVLPSLRRLGVALRRIHFEFFEMV